MDICIRHKLTGMTFRTRLIFPQLLSLVECQMICFPLLSNLHATFMSMALQPQVFLEAEVVYVQALAQQL